jgi:hypothetical protein
LFSLRMLKPYPAPATPLGSVTGITSLTSQFRYAVIVASYFRAAIRRITALNDSLGPAASAGGRPQWGQPNQALAALGLGRIEAATRKETRLMTTAAVAAAIASAIAPAVTAAAARAAA